MPRAEIKTFGKLNFILYVHGRRADGYHEVTTLYVPIDLYDTVVIEAGPGEGVYVNTDGPSVPRDMENIAGRAAALVLKRLRTRAKVKIEIKKNIPAGAGLAGGSSDAAAVLIALPWALGRHLGDDELLELARELGSDVAFFLTESWAWGTGRGEVIEPFRGAADVEFVLAAPFEPVSTHAVYQEIKPEEYSAHWPDPAVVARVFTDASEKWEEHFKNDLTAPAERLYPSITELKNILRSANYHPVLSGSGGSVFARVKDPKNADGLVSRLRNEGFWARIVKTI